ncbi:MAG TPA: DinB family protein [Terriglobia bacterium]|nr:DinB family protein [Terriglobia bacterium]
MMRNDNPSLRQHLLYLLRGGGAHLNFNSTIRGFPIELRGVRPAGLPQTAWRLLEHMRIAQRDILDFCIDSKYIPKDFPSGYWPQNDSPANKAAWNKSIRSFRADLKAMEQLVANPSTDLFALIPHGEGQTILREALLVADHNAYHLGQMVTLRRLLGAWTDP